MNNKVIYTCLTGSYDDLKQPLAINPDWDYICFSDCLPLGKNGVWDVRPIPFDNHNKIRKSRYAKMLPHRVLQEYDWSLYHDANIQIAESGFYNRLEELIGSQTDVAHVTHPQRDCIYDEIIECTRFNLDKLENLSAQWKFLKSEGFPEHFGLYENNLIFRHHNSDKIKEAMELWWDIFDRHGRRDQLSLCYVYWLNSIRPRLILPAEYCTRNTTLINYYRHPNNKTLFKRIKSRSIISRNRCIIAFSPLRRIFFPSK